MNNKMIRIRLPEKANPNLPDEIDVPEGSYCYNLDSDGVEMQCRCAYMRYVPGVVDYEKCDVFFKNVYQVVAGSFQGHKLFAIEKCKYCKNAPVVDGNQKELSEFMADIEIPSGKIRGIPT